MQTSLKHKKLKGISGSTLKIIAIATMLLDHIGASILEPLLINEARTAGAAWSLSSLAAVCPKLAIPYFTLRYIGRIAFPIFCFLLVEGFLHTNNLVKYILRLFAFAFISEIPFDLAFHGEVFYMDSQNVFFTLFIGLITIAALRSMEERFAEAHLFCTIGYLIVLAAGMIAAEWLQTDYGAMGVLTISTMYLLRRMRVLAMLSGCIILVYMNSTELTSLIGILPVSLYNGERGLKLKYFFYAFYPVHLFLLFLLCRFMGIY